MGSERVNLQFVNFATVDKEGEMCVKVPGKLDIRGFSEESSQLDIQSTPKRLRKGRRMERKTQQLLRQKACIVIDKAGFWQKKN